MRKQKKIEAAKAFLRAHMTPGKTYDAGEVISAAQRAGHKERTLQYAAELLHIRKKFNRSGGVTRWEWILPDESIGAIASKSAHELVTT